MSIIGRRMRKLEQSFPVIEEDLSVYAFDDLTVRLLKIIACLIADEDLSEQEMTELEQRRRCYAEQMRGQAALRRLPEYQAGLRMLASEIPDFVPAIFPLGDPDPTGRIELYDLGHAGLFERRLGYLEHPEVQALMNLGTDQPIRIDPWVTVGSALTPGASCKGLLVVGGLR